MRICMVALMAFFLDTVISANIIVVYSADSEVVGQYFFRFGVTEVKGDFSALERRYKISGVYEFGHDFNSGGTFDLNKRKVLASFEWSADGRFNPANKATYEKLDLIDRKKRTAAGSFTSKMECNEDPWLEPYSSGRCQKIIIEPSDPAPFRNDLTSTAAPDIPFSAALTTTERFRLNQQFAVFLAARQKIGPGPLAMDESTAPIIVYPFQNGYMVHRKSEFIIQPNPKFTGDEIFVEFTRLDTGVKTKPWKLPTTLFTTGVLIPDDIFGPNPGRYAMRARIDSPKPGAFSREVRFEYLMQSPKILFPPSNPPIKLEKR
jgi:hypothetical protein